MYVYILTRPNPCQVLAWRTAGYSVLWVLLDGRLYIHVCVCVCVCVYCNPAR